MPKDSKLDKCHEAVKKDLEKKHVPDADGKAWGVCKKIIPGNTSESGLLDDNKNKGK
jgi:hypothetical protein